MGAPLDTGTSLAAYREFLRSKIVMAGSHGFEVDPAEINPRLKDFVREAIVPWAASGGRRAIFSSFGLHKTSTQIELARLANLKTGVVPLIVVPLGVRQEFFEEAEARFTGDYAVRLHFIRRTEEAEAGPGVINVTNYESARDGKIAPAAFGFVSLDEAAALRGFGGTKTFRQFMKLFAGDDRDGGIKTDGVRFRYVATATPDPNEFIELLAYAAFLGIMDVGQAKTRFFKRDSEHADQLTIHPHKQKEFWLWVASWALFVRRPSDLCRCECHNENNCRENGSGTSLSNAGSRTPNAMELGSADAIAVVPTSQPQVISNLAELSVADVSGRSTAAKELVCSQSGRECSTDVAGQTTRIGPTTVDEGSPSATVGTPSPTSETIWASHQTVPPSTGSTTTATTSREIVGGPRAQSRRVTVEPAPDGGGNTSSCRGCRCNDGYNMPALDVRWHEVPSDHRAAGHERDGQARMFKNSAFGVQDAAKEKRESLPARIEAMQCIRAEAPEAHRILWHDLEAERAAIEDAVPDVVSIYGSQDLETNEKNALDFKHGRIRELATKPSMSGAGCNFQKHCAHAVFLGIGHKFHDFIQAVHRLQRFGQTETVRLDLIYSEAERETRRNLEAKWKRHEAQAEIMQGIIREFGLSQAALASTLQRSFGVRRQEISGENYRLINNDCVEEAHALASNSAHLIVTSIPFSTQYEYTPSYNDFGHTDDDAHFWAQMDFLTPQLLRVLQPGRVAAIHVKDRIVPGGINGLGFQTVSPFSDQCVAHFRKHGFAFLARKTIVTDVVRENNQTYRLGWTEQCKDGSRMGAGMPEYLLLFRRPPSDASNGYADVPVVKEKREWKRDHWTNDGYSRARWQVDAHGFQRSSGNRLLTGEEMVGLPADVIYKTFRQFSAETVYDFERHVQIAETLESKGSLPPTFMLLPPASWHPDVWSDVTRMRTLNGAQHAKGREMHLCALQFDIVDRTIAQFTMPGETVLDPFGGLMTVPYRALLQKRRGIAIELSTAYWRDGAIYCEAAERQMSMPSLFDFDAVASRQPQEAAA